MITKWIAIIWIGLGQTQTLSTTIVDSETECQAVVAAYSIRFGQEGMTRTYDCIPYSFQSE